MGFRDLKKRFNDRKQKSEGGSDVLYLKPDEKHYVRLIPRLLTEDEEKSNDPWINQIKHTLVHYQSNKVVPRTTFSPLNWESSDVLEDFCNDELDQRKVDKEEFKFLINLKPNDCYMVPAIVRGKEEDGAKVFVMSQNQYENFLDSLENAFLPEDPPEIWNPKDGYDLVVEVKSPKTTGKKYNTTSITVQRNSSPLNNDDLSVDEAKKIIAEQPKWDDAYQRKSNDELMSYLKNYLENGADSSGSADVYDGETSDESDDEGWDDAYGTSDDIDQAEVDDALNAFKSQQQKNNSQEASNEESDDSFGDFDGEEELEEELEEENPFG